MIEFEIIIKRSTKELARIKGFPRDTQDLSCQDIEDVIKTEQYLERLLGLRVHINSRIIKDGE